MALPIGTGAQMTMLIDGSRQILLNDINVSIEDNTQDIDTLDGLAGFSGGSVKFQVTGTTALLTSGPEFNFASASINRVVHVVTVPYGNQLINIEGVFKSPGWKGGANQNSDHSFSFTGVSSDFDPS